ncbi:MAG TPA: hypothetical protein VJJ25_01740 [Nitrosopumilaceae archaeon]|nr:hypothetical protein [Nitrosopumilaceae archaeon]
MQPIIMLGIVGVAAIAMSMGFLMPEIPVFNLQGVAINERSFSTPITTANVDIEISKVSTQTLRSGEGLLSNNLIGTTTITKTVFMNLIKECSFHTPSEGLGTGSTVICKLSDANGDIIAEGKLELPNGLSPSDVTFIPIEQTAYRWANEVQNIDDIKIIVQGTDPTQIGE